MAGIAGKTLAYFNKYINANPKQIELDGFEVLKQSINDLDEVGKKVILACFADEIPKNFKKNLALSMTLEKAKPIFGGAQEVIRSLNKFNANSKNFKIELFNSVASSMNQELAIQKINHLVLKDFYSTLIKLCDNKVPLNEALKILENKSLYDQEVNSENKLSQSKSVLVECIKDLVSKPKKSKLQIKEIYNRLINHTLNHSMKNIPELNNLDYETKVCIATIMAGEMLNTYVKAFFNKVKENETDKNLNQENDLIISNKSDLIIPNFKSKENEEIDNSIVNIKKEKENVDQNSKCILF